MGGEVGLEGGFEAVAYREVQVGAHHDAVALDLPDMVHVDYIRAVDLQEIVGQSFLDAREGAEGQQRRRVPVDVNL